NLMAGALGGLCFSPDGRQLVLPVTDQVRLWDVDHHVLSGAPFKSQDPTATPYNTAALSPDGRTLAASTYNSTISVWDVAEGDRAHPYELKDNAKTGSGLLFSADSHGRTLAAGYLDGTVHLWSLLTRPPKPVGVLQGPGPKAYVGGLTFAPDGSAFAA